MIAVQKPTDGPLSLATLSGATAHQPAERHPRTLLVITMAD
jgi:hypothetical protein